MNTFGLLVLAMGTGAAGMAATAEPRMPEPWRAEWIGPAVPPAVNLDGAAWIWTVEAGVDATRNAPAGERHYRREFVLPGNGPVRAAVAIFTADDRCRLVVNGVDAGGSDDWRRAAVLDVTALLRPGTNRLDVRCANGEPAGSINAAGLIGRLRVERGDGEAAEIVTDASWQGSVPAATAAWAPVRVLGAYGRDPWGRGVAGASSDPVNAWTCYRKDFTLTERPTAAVARIAVDSKYWLWVNGRLAVYEGGLKRGPNPRDTYFDVVDLAPFLQGGSNTVAALVWYWGKDGFSHKSSGRSGFLFEMDGLRSDASWKMLRHPAYRTTGDPHPNFRLQDDNIHFDARRDPGDWIAPGFDDAAWPTAAAFGRPPCAPWNGLIERPIPLWRVGDLTAYENARELPRVSDGKPIVARLPRNLTVSPYLRIRAPAGLPIDMRTDNYKGGSEYNFRSEYITREGEQEFESLAYLNGHAMIYSIPAGVEISALRYRETRYHADFVGRFTCDDPFLNTLWVKCLNTMNVNMRDGIQDPDRERAQWWGDAAILLGEILHSCDTRGHALIRKAMLNLVDWQKPDGVLYSPVPAGNWDKELPGQMLSSIGEHGFWYYYRHTGDRATMAHVYPAVRRYLALWKLGDDGLVVHRAGGWDWGDWGENIDRPVMDNALLYQALGAASEMARVNGQDADIPGYEAMRASIAANLNRVLWTGTEYRSPGYHGKTDDRGHGLAALYGLARPEQYAAIKKVLAQSFEASPYMEKYILESLFCMGDATAALARMKSRYRKMVESEITTLWEGWGIGAEGYGGGSYNHGWSGGPLTLLMEYVAGISPTSPGFGTFQVMPQMGPLRHIRAVVPTVRGNVEVEIRREPGRFALNLVSPPGTPARVGLPVTGPVRCNGRAVDPIETRGIHRIFDAPPGSSRFEVVDSDPAAPLEKGP